MGKYKAKRTDLFEGTGELYKKADMEPQQEQDLFLKVTKGSEWEALCRP